MNSRLLAPLGLLALLVLGAVWFLQNFERVPGKEKVPPSAEARLREFLAAERFAERMGMPARELRSLGDLDAPSAGVLLMPRRRQAIDTRRASHIMGWVQRGGHLIVEAELIGVADPLLDAAGVRREPRKERSQPLAADLGERRVTVLLASRMSLRAAGRPRLRLDDQLLSVPRGKGLVSAVTTLDFARNAGIGAPGHAQLLWTLLTLSPAPGLQVFFHPVRLSLWGFLADNAAPALAGAFLLLGLWLWRIAPRFGPLPADAPPARRRLLEHLRASGRYLWMEGLRAELAAAARDAALRRLARAQPDFAAVSATERAARLASLAAIPIEDAQRFLAAGGSPRGADLMRLAAIAQRVHLALEKGTR